MPRLANKNAIVTGGNRGIGREIALAYAREGANVVITYHTGENEAEYVGAEIKKLGNVKVKAFKLDITQESDRVQLVDEAVKFLGKINILVNCAGVCPRETFLDASEKIYDQVMNII